MTGRLTKEVPDRDEFQGASKIAIELTWPRLVAELSSIYRVKRAIDAFGAGLLSACCNTDDRF